MRRDSRVIAGLIVTVVVGGMATAAMVLQRKKPAKNSITASVSEQFPPLPDNRYIGDRYTAISSELFEAQQERNWEAAKEHWTKTIELAQQHPRDRFILFTVLTDYRQRASLRDDLDEVGRLDFLIRKLRAENRAEHQLSATDLPLTDKIFATDITPTDQLQFVLPVLANPRYLYFYSASKFSVTPVRRRCDLDIGSGTYTVTPTGDTSAEIVLKFSPDRYPSEESLSLRKIGNNLYLFRGNEWAGTEDVPN